MGYKGSFPIRGNIVEISDLSIKNDIDAGCSIKEPGLFWKGKEWVFHDILVYGMDILFM